jgi:hypothetical protein
MFVSLAAWFASNLLVLAFLRGARGPDWRMQ